MFRGTKRTLAVISLLMFILLVSGCGGSSKNLKRVAGLSPDAVVKTFVTAAKDNKINEAGLYVSPESKNDARTVLNFLTGNIGLDQLKNVNLLSVKQAAQQGDFSVVVAVLQEQQNSFKITIKPVGLEKINGEWYIVDFDQIYRDAKYKILQQLLASI